MAAARRKTSMTLYIAPLGTGWSVKEGTAYYGDYPTQTRARDAAEKLARELEAEGHEVTILTTDKKPGGR
jgi:hypothetical protein